MNNFENFGLSKKMNNALADMKFVKPTPIQIKAIPIVLNGSDILGSAQTGTGKTAAFCIPIIEMLSKDEKSIALIMMPTRELARQVLDVINQLTNNGDKIKSACLIGGEALRIQIRQLKDHPRIIVGTPGRINDHLENKKIDLKHCTYLVLDETDRMLDMGFGKQIDKIFKHLPIKKQILLFSATLPDKIIELSKKYLHDPERVAIKSDNVLLTNIDHNILNIDHNKKYKELLNQLSTREGSVLIFAKTKFGTQRMAKKLCEDGFKADALNGNLNQSKRDRVMSDFRFKKFKVLVATDIASRGLDIDHIQHVINYDLPQVAEDYIHRIGRTGRAGSSGSTICFVSPEEQNIWDEIYYLLHPDTAKKPKKNNSRAVRKRSRESLRQKKPTRSFSKSNGPRRRNNSNTGKDAQKKSECKKEKKSNQKKHSKNTVSRSTKTDNSKRKPHNKTNPRAASKKPLFSKAKGRSKVSRSNSH
jgi:superfamily II DNA/RNA helicase